MHINLVEQQVTHQPGDTRKQELHRSKTPCQLITLSASMFFSAAAP
jgi:hypothetical protein